MKPTALRAAPSRQDSAGEDAALTALMEYGDLRRPQDCDQPILATATRQAIHSWLYELNYADPLAEVGVKPRQRALLTGLPGTGKTTLAWHISARLGLPLLVVETPSIVSKFIGQTGEQIGKLFKLARGKAGEVALFFDEFDAMATKRGDTGSSACQEKNAIVVALLQMMDRHDGLIFAATNRGDNIDAAVWRRFQLQITVDLPGPGERFAILRRYLAPFTADDDTLQIIADLMEGASPALIREVSEALKRDLVLGPRIGHDMAPAAMFERVLSSIAPSDDMPTPPLWAERTYALGLVSGVNWPPVR